MLHNYKKRLTWELLNRKVNQFITTNYKNNRKIAKFAGKDITLCDLTSVTDYEFVVHTASDRALTRILKKHNLFENSPYLSCSLINNDLGTFKVNPSLLQASVVIEFPADAVFYAIGRDIGSPTNKYNTNEEQNIFFRKLNQQTFFSNLVDGKIREVARKKHVMGTTNWSRSSMIVEKITAAALTQELKSADPKKSNIDALPLLSVDMLRSNTHEPYNEILLKRSDVKIKAILFHQADWENALKSIELQNYDAVNAMHAISDANLPIFIIKNSLVFHDTDCFDKLNKPQDQLLFACKNHDLDLLQVLLQSIDAKKYAGRALQEACYQGDLSIVKLLIDHGADVNYEEGKCLEAAFYRSQTEIVKHLIANGADIERNKNHLLSYLDKRPNDKLKALINETQLTYHRISSRW